MQEIARSIRFMTTHPMLALGFNNPALPTNRD
jgi:hypothetical protein